MLGIDSPTIREEVESYIAVSFFRVVLFLIIAPFTPDKILVCNGTINPPL